jgi:hypothetical protein
MQPDICNADNEDCTAEISAGPHTGIHSERQHMLSTHMQIMQVVFLQAPGRAFFTHY